MIHLRLDSEDRLVLEAPWGDPAIARTLRSILLAFVVVDRTDTSVVLDRVGNNVEAVAYLISTAEQAGWELTLGPELEEVMSSHELEKARLDQARRIDTPPTFSYARPWFRARG